MSTFFSVSVFRCGSMCESGFCLFLPISALCMWRQGVWRKDASDDSIMGRCCHSSKRVVCSVARDCGNCSQSGGRTLRDRRMTAAASALTIPPFSLLCLCSSARPASPLPVVTFHSYLRPPLSPTCASWCLTNFSSHHPNSSLLCSPRLSTCLLLVYSPQASGCHSLLLSPSQSYWKTGRAAQQEHCVCLLEAHQWQKISTRLGRFHTVIQSRRHLSACVFLLICVQCES